MATLKTYSVQFDVSAKITLKVRGVDQLAAQGEALKRLGPFMRSVEDHYDRVAFADNYSGMTAELVKDPIALASASRREKRAAEKAAQAAAAPAQENAPVDEAAAPAPETPAADSAA